MIRPREQLAEVNERHVRLQRYMQAVFLLAHVELRDLPDLAAEIHHAYSEAGYDSIIVRQLRAAAVKLEELTDGRA